MNKKAFEKGYRDACSRCGVDLDALFKHAEGFSQQDAMQYNRAPAPIYNGMPSTPLSPEYMRALQQAGGDTSNTGANPVVSSASNAQRMAPDPAQPAPPPVGRSFMQRLSGAIRPAVDSATEAGSAAGSAIGGVGNALGTGISNYIDTLAGTPSSELRSGIANPNTKYMDTPENRAKLIALDEASSRARLGAGGAIGGAALGGGLGAMVGGKKRRALGAFIGALAGGAAGSTIGMV